MKVTVERLKKLGACRGQVARFERMWPRGAVVTLRRALRAGRAGLDVDWLAWMVLRHRALAAYNEATAPARAAYKEAAAPARATYQEASARAFVAALKEQEAEDVTD